jgi:hypothetical protein
MMKNYIKTFCLLLILQFGKTLYGQTSVTITYAFDSSAAFTHCNPPQLFHIDCYGNASGYTTATDSIDLHAYWGDGSDTLMRVPIYSGGGTWADYFGASVPHWYTSAGTFYWMITATAPDGMADTAKSIPPDTLGPVIIYSGCVQVDGYIYQDNNSNCLFDAGDDTCRDVLSCTTLRVILSRLPVQAQAGITLFPSRRD